MDSTPLLDEEQINPSQVNASPKNQGRTFQQDKEEVVLPIEDKENKKTEDSSEDAKEHSEKLKPVPFFKLFKLASKNDKIFIGLGAFGSVLLGACLPALSYIMGDLYNAFGPDADMVDLMAQVALNMLEVSAVAYVGGFMLFCFWMQVGERIALKYRKMYLEILVRKNVTWFDLNRPQELPSTISLNCKKIQEACGDKIGQLIYIFSLSIFGIISGFIFGWKLACVFIILLPISFLSIYAWTKSMTAAEGVISKAYEVCGGLAQEVFSNIRTVYSFGGEHRALKQYKKELKPVKKAGKKKGLYIGLGLGIMNFGMLVTFAVGFYIGSYFIQKEVMNSFTGEAYSCSDVIRIFFTVTMGFFALGQTSPHMSAINLGKAAAAHFFNLLENTDNEEQNTGTDTIPAEQFQGFIEFENVDFCYPSRPTIKVLDQMNVGFLPGSTTAICGETGSGKSTIVQLIEKFYSGGSGSIRIDGREVSQLDTNWVRENIGYVGQEPVLFNVSIRQNILYGKEDASPEEIHNACEKANCLEFIEDLPEKFETIVGIEGGQLSGGQKQRIAIARAIIRNPKILILDEATSALDRTCEAEVNEAIRKASRGITTIVIAHRLTTIFNTDKIVVLHQGKVMEEGTHQELLSFNKLYASLYNTQLKKDKESDMLQQKLKKKTSVDQERKQSGIDHNLIEEEEKLDKLPSEEEKNEDEREISLLQNAIENEENEKQELERQEKHLSGNITKLAWSKQENKGILILGSFLALLYGCYMPLLGYIFGKFTNDLLYFANEKKEGEIDRETINYDVIFMVALGLGTGILAFFLVLLFEIEGSKIEYKLRPEIYKRMLRMHIGWYDNPKNTPAQLTSTLFDDVNKFNGIIRIIGETLVSCVSAIGVALFIAFFKNWQISLVILAICPLMTIGSAIELKLSLGYAKENEAIYKSAMDILSESVTNIRTVLAFSYQNKLIALHNRSLIKPEQNIKRKGILSGLAFGFSQALVYNIYGISFYLGAVFINKGFTSTSSDMFIAIYAILFGANYIGVAQQFAPDMGKAKAAVINIEKIYQSKTKINSQIGPHEAINLEGKIEFKNVYFKYPNRNEWVLKNLSLIIEPGNRAALVGTSGSGKSTIIQLLQRFYDVNSGEILIDNIDIKDYKLNSLRKYMALIMQEPKLFDDTIKNNILYGKKKASFEEVREAARKAEALEFIESNQIELVQDSEKANEDNGKTNKDSTSAADVGEGFERRVGTKGAQISGGQKQRIAIARAIIRNPKILLMDEATSALDAETERLVQLSIEEEKERTSLAIAHRISTIQNSNAIYVLQNGRIEERGTHDELMALNGNYFKLVKGTGSSSL